MTVNIRTFKIDLTYTKETSKAQMKRSADIESS